MKKFITLIFSIALLLTSCVAPKLKEIEKNNISRFAKLPGKQIIKHFEFEMDYYFICFGLTPVSKKSLDNRLFEEIILNNGEGICNLRLESSTNAGFSVLSITLSYLASGAILGSMIFGGSDSEYLSYIFPVVWLIAPSSTTLTIEGDIYKSYLNLEALDTYY